MSLPYRSLSKIQGHEHTRNNFFCGRKPTWLIDKVVDNQGDIHQVLPPHKYYASGDCYVFDGVTSSPNPLHILFCKVATSKSLC